MPTRRRTVMRSIAAGLPDRYRRRTHLTRAFAALIQNRNQTPSWIGADRRAACRRTNTVVLAALYLGAGCLHPAHCAYAFGLSQHVSTSPEWRCGDFGICRSPALLASV